MIDLNYLIENCEEDYFYVRTNEYNNPKALRDSIKQEHKDNGWVLELRPPFGLLRLYRIEQ